MSQLAEYKRDSSYELLLSKSERDRLLEKVRRISTPNKFTLSAVGFLLSALLGIGELEKGCSFRQAILPREVAIFIMEEVDFAEIFVKRPLPMVK